MVKSYEKITIALIFLPFVKNKRNRERLKRGLNIKKSVFYLVLKINMIEYNKNK